MHTCNHLAATSADEDIDGLGDEENGAEKKRDDSNEEEQQKKEKEKLVS